MSNNNDSQKKCGFCGETIPARASRCPYCGSILEVTFDNAYGGDQPNQPDDQGPVNDDTPNTAQSPESAMDPGQTQPQDTAPAQSQYQPQQEVPAEYQPQQGGQGQWQNTERPVQDYQRPYYQNRPQQGQRYEKPALSNGLKVFLTMLFTLLPGIGQLAGIITAIVFMSSEGDSDRRSFGVALLVACIIMFVLACIGCFIISIASASLPFSTYYNY